MDDAGMNVKSFLLLFLVYQPLLWGHVAQRARHVGVNCEQGAVPLKPVVSLQGRTEDTEA